MFAAKDTLLTRPSGGAYQISRSVRLRASASAYLNRTPASASNRKTWTWSGWVKATNTATNQVLFDAYSSSTSFCFIRFSDPSGSLRVTDVSSNVTQFNYESTALYRDFSAWYHIVVAVDTTQVTASNRVKIYVNGVQLTAFSASTNPSQNYDGFVNSTIAHDIGRSGGNSSYLDGYLTEINFVDGQALTPSSFGETNSVTGVWQPKKYAGTYGTNGFYLNFSDNSAATATTIGKDYSGNGNNWTPSAGISLTAGATYDSMLDVPTLYADGGNGRGNYAVLNPLAKDTDVTLSSGNLNFSCTSSGLGGAIGTIAVSSGKWYWEVTVTGGTASAVGIAKLPLSAYDANQTGTYLYLPSGDKRLSPSTDSAYGASYTTNDVIGVALNMDAGTVVFYKNNSSQGTAFSSLSGDFTAWMQDGTSGSASTFVANFGQRPFTYTPPTGFVALNTQNLP